MAELTPAEALQQIEPHCWTAFKICKFCEVDRYPEDGGYRQDHKPDCPVSRLAAAVEDAARWRELHRLSSQVKAIDQGKLDGWETDACPLDESW